MNKSVDLIYGIPSDRQTQEPPTTVANDRSPAWVLGLWLSKNNSSLNTLEHKSSEQKSGIYLNTWEITEKYAFNAHFQDKGVSWDWDCLHWDSHINNESLVPLKEKKMPAIGETQMTEEKDTCLSSPVRTSKLQLGAEQSSTRECWIPPKKDTPHPREKEKPQQDSRRGKSHLKSNLRSARDAQRVQTKPCVHQERGKGAVTLTSDWASLASECLNVSWRGTGQQWPEVQTGTLATADLGGTECGIGLLGGACHRPPL